MLLLHIDNVYLRIRPRPYLRNRFGQEGSEYITVHYNFGACLIHDFFEKGRGVVKFYNNLNLHSIVRHIETKFESPNSYNFSKSKRMLMLFKNKYNFWERRSLFLLVSYKITASFYNMRRGYKIISCHQFTRLL